MKKVILLWMLVASTAFAEDFSGVWNVSGDVADNSITPVCTFKQADQTISGSCKLDADHTAEVTGAVKGNDVTWSYDVVYEGSKYKLTFAGRVGADKTMKGTISVDPSDATGEFTAKLQ